MSHFTLLEAFFHGRGLRNLVHWGVRGFFLHMKKKCLIKYLDMMICKEYNRLAVLTDYG